MSTRKKLPVNSVIFNGLETALFDSIYRLFLCSYLKVRYAYAGHHNIMQLTKESTYWEIHVVWNIL